MKKAMLFTSLLFFLLPSVSQALEAVWDDPTLGDNVTSLTLFWQRHDGSGDVYNITDQDARAPLALDESRFEPGVQYDFWAVFRNANGPSPNSDIATWTRPMDVGPPPDKIPTHIYLPPGAPVVINIR